MSLDLDLELDDAQQALADAVAALCRDHCDDAVVRATDGLPRESWRALAALGVFEIGAGEGGALEMVAALEALGRAVFPGPLVGTFVACRLLPEAERRRVAAGDAIVCLAAPPLLPWGTLADVFVEIDAETRQAFRARPVGELMAVSTLGGEPFARAALERLDPLPGAAEAIALGDVARAAYLAAAGRRLVEDAAEHARTRKQFGKAIGEFQAVAHPLADAAIALDGARALARNAAWRFDQGEPDAAAFAVAARRSATRAALDAIHTGHQVFGAVGITLEGPAFPISRRIRQLASLPPADRHGREAILEAFVPSVARSEVHP